MVKPSVGHLPSYVAALQRGWSPDNVRPETAREQLLQIAHCPGRFLEAYDDPLAKREPVRLPDGTFAERIPGIRRWMWDGEFCGLVGLRWQAGTAALPPNVLGHIGYTVVPWKRGRGHATRALAALLPEARERGLPFVDLVTYPDNIASQKVITANGGVLVERFRPPPAYGATEALRYRIEIG